MMKGFGISGLVRPVVGVKTAKKHGGKPKTVNGDEK
jgi:hypothetical protein